MRFPELQVLRSAVKRAEKGRTYKPSTERLETVCWLLVREGRLAVEAKGVFRATRAGISALRLFDSRHKLAVMCGKTFCSACGLDEDDEEWLSRCPNAS